MRTWLDAQFEHLRDLEADLFLTGEPFYLCLRCTRDNLTELDLDSVTFDPILVDRINRVCGYCGRELPESKKRELKAENLLLRAKLARAELSGNRACRFYIDDAARMEGIAEAAIANAHEHYRMVRHWRGAFRTLQEFGRYA